MEITKGKWEISERLQVQANADEPLNISTICQVFGKEKNHAILIADAGNTYQATNKLPSELAEANKELLEALKSILKSHRQMSFEKDGNLNDTFIETKIDNLIKKHTNHA